MNAYVSNKYFSETLEDGSELILIDDEKANNELIPSVIVSKTAFYILECCSLPKTIDELVSLMTQKYDVDEKVVYNDIKVCLNNLLNCKLIKETY